MLLDEKTKAAVPSPEIPGVPAVTWKAALLNYAVVSMVAAVLDYLLSEYRVYSYW